MDRNKRGKLKRVLEALSAAYGRPEWKCWGKALDVLVETILSQNTNNANSSAGYRQLRRRFRTWSAVADAPVGEVEECIRVSGLSKIKAPRIQKILRQIRDSQNHECQSHESISNDAIPGLAAGADGTSALARGDPKGVTPVGAGEGNVSVDAHGLEVVQKTQSKTSTRGDKISLEFLRDWDIQHANDYLLSFDGVGPKTAACVLLFSFHMPIFPVDTHIHRIAIRLGLIDSKASAEEAQRLLTPLITPADRYAMHILLITHGRRTCRAASPRCEWCDLRRMCRHVRG